MKLLFDENLSPRLVQAVADLYPGSAHVHECGLASSSDIAIWQYALEKGFAIVSKDFDFEERSVLFGHPPKVIWLRVGNCTSARIEQLLRSTHLTIAQFSKSEQESCLILTLTS